MPGAERTGGRAERQEDLVCPCGGRRRRGCQRSRQGTSLQDEGVVSQSMAKGEGGWMPGGATGQ